MTERAQAFMNSVWDARNNQGADTEEKLVSAVLRLAAETIQWYTIQWYAAQNDMVVLDKNDMLKLAQELENLK